MYPIEGLLLGSRDEASVDDVSNDAAPEVTGFPRRGQSADKGVPHDLLAQHSRSSCILVLERREQWSKRCELESEKICVVFDEALT